MPDDLAQQLAQELVKQLPVPQVYQEGVSGAITETGKLLTDIAKTLRLALAPFQLMGAFQDRFGNFVDHSIRRVPQENRVPPAPQILGPTFEALRYEPADTPIDEMFSQLLSRSLDRTRNSEAHPAYPILIRQLSSDEAVLLKLLKTRTYKLVFERELSGDGITSPKTFGPIKPKLDELPRQEFAFPDNALFYMEHLERLGLALIQQEGQSIPIWTGDPTKGTRKQIGIEVNAKYALTDFGNRFVRACTND